MSAVIRRHINIPAFQTQWIDKEHFLPSKNDQGGDQSLETEIKLFKSNVPHLLASTHYFYSRIISSERLRETSLPSEGHLLPIKQFLYEETNHT